MSLSRVVVVTIASIFLGLPAALAQQCKSGAVNCPTYTAPATTSVPGPAIGGNIAIPDGGMSTLLFDGAVPPNGFMVQLTPVPVIEAATTCYVNDNGPAQALPPTVGFIVERFRSSTPLPSLFVTPQGYKPMGPVSIACNGPAHIEVRAW